MNELEILNHYQLAFVANAAYMLTFTGLIFITFRLVMVLKRTKLKYIRKNIGFRFWTMYCFLWI